MSNLDPDRQRRRKTAAGVAVGVLATYVLGSAWWGTSHLQDDLTVASRQALASAGLTGVDVVYDGRDAVITGVTGAAGQAGQGSSGSSGSGALSAQMREKIAAVVGAVDGTAQVVFRDGAASGTSAASAAPTATAAPRATQSATATPSASSTPSTSSSPSSPTTSPTPSSTATPTGKPTTKPTRVPRPSGTLRFAYRSSDLTRAGVRLLGRVAAYVLASSTRTVTLAAYTDNVGGYASNRELSRQRAQVVLDALVKLGVPASRMTIAAYGEDHPAASNDTDAGRSLNRRVEFVFKEG